MFLGLNLAWAIGMLYVISKTFDLFVLQLIALKLRIAIMHMEYVNKNYYSHYQQQLTCNKNKHSEFNIIHILGIDTVPTDISQIQLFECSA